MIYKQISCCQYLTPVDYVLDHRHELFWSMIDLAFLSNDKHYTDVICGSGSMPALSIDGNIYPCFRWLPHTKTEVRK
jgi:hypothetical protein